MIAFTLETLVLRVVRTDVLGVLRLVGVETTAGLPGNATSVLPPARTGPDSDPDAPDKVGYPTKGASPRAGRSCRHAGSSSRQQIVRIAAMTWRRLGGMARAAAATARAFSASVVASVSEGDLRLAVLSLGKRGRSR
jgi:hypothetical protein